MCFSTEARSTSSRSACLTAGSLNSGCCVLGLERSPSTSVHGSVLLSWMCSIARLWHDLGATPGVAAVFQPDKDLVLDLHVPGVVVLAGLDHGARRRNGVAAALHLDRVEIRPVGDMIGGIALASDHVARFELDKPVRAGADRLQVCRRIARIGALVGVRTDASGRSCRAADEQTRPRTASASRTAPARSADRSFRP